AAQSQQRPDQELAEAVDGLDGVAEAEALSRVFLQGESTGMDMMLLAGNLPQTRDIDVAEGSLPEQDGEILLAEDFAGTYGIEVGDTMPVTTERDGPEAQSEETGSAELTVTGIAGGNHRRSEEHTSELQSRFD